MRLFRAELHIHTVLSPCADIEMLPPLIIEAVIERGINLIAITDHNATANIAAVQEAAIGSDITILAGMEIQTREEVHSLCLFDTLEQVQALQHMVDQHLSSGKNNPEFFGNQLIVDRDGEFLQEEDRMLISSISLSIEQTCEAVHQLDGIFIPAHVNRKTFGLFENLGFVPENLEVVAPRQQGFLRGHCGEESSQRKRHCDDKGLCQGFKRQQ